MFLVGATLKWGSSSLNSIHVIVEYVNSNTCTCRLHHCTAAREHSPLIQEVVLAGNGCRWDCIFLQDYLVGPDVF